MDKVLTINEAMKITGKAKRTLQQHCQNGVIPAEMVHRDWRIKLSDLQAWLDSDPKPGRPRLEQGRTQDESK